MRKKHHHNANHDNSLGRLNPLTLEISLDDDLQSANVHRAFNDD